MIGRPPKTLPSRAAGIELGDLVRKLPHDVRGDVEDAILKAAIDGNYVSLIAQVGDYLTARLATRGGLVHAHPPPRPSSIWPLHRCVDRSAIGQPDIQIVFGPNEAGKSTAMAAIEDLLFGIPSNSPRNFLHDYGVMRVGAVLENDGHSLNVRRRKGNKDTLLSENEVPFPAGDGALASFLAGADRRFYTRMFSLDHDRLRQGGKEILEAKDDVGQMLFSAGAGIAGLRERLKTMESEADALWASRRRRIENTFRPKTD